MSFSVRREEPDYDEDQDMSEPLAIHSWATATNISDALVIDARPFKPKTDAAYLINRLAARPVADRAIRFWGGFPDMAVGDQAATLLNGVYTHGYYSYYRELFQRLAAAKIVPSFLIFDHESLLGFWSWSTLITMTPQASQLQLIATTLAKLKAKGKLPSYMIGITADDFRSFDARGTAAINAWQRFGLETSYNAMRACIIEPSKRAFGKILPMSNYGDARPAFTLYDPNNWPLTAETAQSLAGWSAPVNYLSHGGGRYAGQAKPQQWNVFIDCVSNVRSMFARGADVSPWISFPTYDRQNGESISFRRWLWRQMLLHVRANGAKRLLYWNPPELMNGPSDNLYAKTVFDELAKMPGSRQELPAIPLNVDKVTTLGITTTYTQFEAALNS